MIYVDSSFVREPGPTHTLAMSSTAINGLSVQITKIAFDDFFMRSMSASFNRSAKLRRSRSR